MARRDAPEFSYDEVTKLYHKQIKRADGKYRPVYARTKAELREKQKAVEDDVSNEIRIGVNPLVFEYAKKWYEINTADLSYARKMDYSNAINNHICPQIGQKFLKEVTPDDIKGVLAACAGKSRSLQSKIVTTLKRIFSAAEENHIIKRSPCKDLKAGGYKSESKEALTEKQCTVLIDAMKDTPAYPFVMIGLYSGLRREEILGLNWDCVFLDGTAPHIVVKRAVTFEKNTAILSETLKSKAAYRSIPIPPQLVECLKAEKEKSTADFVVPDSKGSYRSRIGFRNLWQYVESRTAENVKDLGTQKDKWHPWIVQTIDFHVTPHLLRHTYITTLCLSGMNIKRIQYLAGHATVQMTLNIYAHVMANRPEDLYGDVSAAFGYKIEYKAEPQNPATLAVQ